MKFISTEKAPPAIGPYSQAVVANGMIYTSGQIAMDEKGIIVADDIVNQTHQVMKNLFYVLEAADAHFNDVVKTTIFLADMDDFAKVNEVYSHHFALHKPARSTVAVKTLPKNVLIEIECIALANADYLG
ncbi:MAG: Bona fide RidA/YjgF/TdcF/RutC subgroup [uncultured Sulfurovum sp.]|uniref:Bona fide RidA/YjgF/TdcF/RutC subgroup n=1 Tax=uncultured Sulfurovum sp. TaxID=269237 RepID=A0A6S6RTZ3_9BACT|nr:MAG: Bona fide RidA/YjgF/TdcF/RutC subgroup [uncultured Sulfurovum sp.]